VGVKRGRTCAVAEVVENRDATIGARDSEIDRLGLATHSQRTSKTGDFALLSEGVRYKSSIAFNSYKDGPREVPFHFFLKQIAVVLVEI
jgi:hypothetical protein